MGSHKDHSGKFAFCMLVARLLQRSSAFPVSITSNACSLKHTGSETLSFCIPVGKMTMCSSALERRWPLGFQNHPFWHACCFITHFTVFLLL